MCLQYQIFWQIYPWHLLQYFKWDVGYLSYPCPQFWYKMNKLSLCNAAQEKWYKWHKQNISQNDTFDHRLMETLFLLKWATYIETSTSQLHDNMNFGMSNKFYDTLYTLEIQKLTIFGLMVYVLVTIIMKKITNIIIREYLTITITGGGLCRWVRKMIHMTQGITKY